MEVRAKVGDNFLGGEDFTALIVEHFYKHSGVPNEAKQDAAFVQQLIAYAETLKLAFANVQDQELTIIWREQSYSISLSTEEFVELSQVLLARLRTPVERALRDARIRVIDIDEVELAGGASRTPMVRQLVAGMFDRFPQTQVNPDEVVAVGAGVMAGLKMKYSALDEVVMTDVCPYTLSIATSINLPDGAKVHGISSPIIERNTVISVSRVETYYPANERQAIAIVKVFQGEARFVKDNIALGELEIQFPKGGNQEELAFDVRFTYDVNGLLEVETFLHKTKETNRLVIQSQDNSLTDQEINLRLLALAELKTHPREKIENRTLLVKGERLYQQLLGEQLQRIAIEIIQFEKVLEGQNERECRTGSERLAKVLDIFERDSYTASWASQNYLNNTLLEGLELEARHRAEAPENDLVMLCDKDRRVNPFIFPE